jgi:hypothetical protein
MSVNLKKSPRNMRNLLTTAALSGRPSALRLLGGEWAGWSCSYDSQTGALQPVPDRYVSEERREWGQVPSGFEELATESRRADDAFERRTVRLLPEEGCHVENLAAIVTREPLHVSRPGAALDAPLAVDSRVDRTAGLWRLESVFDGLGGKRPRARQGAALCTDERTRVTCHFDAASGRLDAAEPIVVRQERRWSAEASEALRVREALGSRSGLDAAWVSSTVGIGCFGDAEPPPQDAAGCGLALPGGVRLTQRAERLEVSIRTAAGLCWLRRRWCDGAWQLEAGVDGQ